MNKLTKILLLLLILVVVVFSLNKKYGAQAEVFVSDLRFESNLRAVHYEYCVSNNTTHAKVVTVRVIVADCSPNDQVGQYIEIGNHKQIITIQASTKKTVTGSTVCTKNFGSHSSVEATIEVIEDLN